MVRLYKNITIFLLEFPRKKYTLDGTPTGYDDRPSAWRVALEAGYVRARHAIQMLVEECATRDT